MSQWQPIETAPKEPDECGLTPVIILGFAPDEEDWTLESCEGRWSSDPWRDRPPCFVSSIDPDNPLEPPQPTHWMPLPDPPKGSMKLDEAMAQFSEFLSKDKTGLNVDVPENWTLVEIKMKLLDGRVLIDGMFIDGETK